MDFSHYSAILALLPSVLNGVAISFIFAPLTTAAMGYLHQDQMANATGIYNLMRNLGGRFRDRVG